MRYAQKTGELTEEGGPLIAVGYSGFGPGRNNPDSQEDIGIGPIPCGDWDIVEMILGPTKHGPYVLRLEPRPTTNTFGRAGFLIHGDSLMAPGTASHGCIILPRKIREKIWKDPDHHLLVESGLSNPLL